MITQSKIEIVSRNLDVGINSILKRPFQHLFLLYTENDHTPSFISGMPAQGNPITGDIYVKTGKYTERDDAGKENVDFTMCHKSPCFRSVQIEGNTESVFGVWTKMLEARDAINAGHVKYDLPICETALGFFQMLGTQIDRVTTETATSEDLPAYYASQHLCNTRNSNTVVAEVVKFAGIDLKLPTYSDGQVVDVPSVHSVFDKEKLDNQKSNQDSQTQEKFYTISDMFDSLEETGVLDEPITNKERALRMAAYERSRGNAEGVKLYEKMARDQEMIEGFFDSIPGQLTTDEKDEL